MNLSEFDYQLPEELIASEPPAKRDGALMLHAPRNGGHLEHSSFQTLPSRLHRGDLLILNDARVMRARLRGHKVATGGEVEVLLDRPMGEGLWYALGNASKGFQADQVLELGGARAKVVRADPGGQLLLDFDRDPVRLMEEKGELPIPPYLGRPPTPADEERYQTVYAKTPGAVAAPTAGLHFTERTFAELEQRGVQIAFLTLLVGPGTFLPIRVDDTDAHQMLEERFVISPALARAFSDTRRSGHRVVAVGTTVVRALESAVSSVGELAPGAQTTRLFIQPGHMFRAVDGLLTNFHLPKSSLYVLVAAYVGLPRIREVYAEAIATRYRFFSYGDCCLFL